MKKPFGLLLIILLNQGLFANGFSVGLTVSAWTTVIYLDCLQLNTKPISPQCTRDLISSIFTSSTVLALALKAEMKAIKRDCLLYQHHHVLSKRLEKLVSVLQKQNDENFTETEIVEKISILSGNLL